MIVESINSPLSFYGAKSEALTSTENKISLCVILTGIFALLAIVFCPLAGWSMFSAHTCTVISSLSVLGSTITAIFYTRHTLIKDTIEEQFSEQSRYLLRSREIAKTYKNKLKSTEFPLGLKNAANDCWANSMLQFFENIPKYKEALKSCPLSYDGISITNIFEQYDKDQMLCREVSEVDSHVFRMILHEKTPDQISEGHSQEDVTEAIHALEEWLPKIRTKDRVYYSNQGLPSPLEEHNPNLEIVNDNLFLNSQTIDEALLIFPIDLPENLPNAPITLKQVIDTSFQKVGMEGSGSASFSTEIRYPRHSKELRIDTAPDDFCFSLKRFEFNRADNSFNKKSTEIEISKDFTLEKNVHLIDDSANYALKNFIVHEGTTLGGGHYKAYLNKNNIWFECSDTSVREISEEEALQKAKQGYVFHYAKKIIK
jgi:ubiquitin C-terminal hydrolase